MRRGKVALILGIAGGVVAVGATTMVIIGCTTHSIYCYQIPNADCMKGIVLNTDRVQCAWYPCATGISPCSAPDDHDCSNISLFGCSCFRCSWYETPDKQEFKKEVYEFVPIHENDYTYRLYAQMDQSIGEYRLAIEINFVCVVSWAEVKTNISGGGAYSSTWRMEETNGDLVGAYSPGTYYGSFDTTLTSPDQASSAKVQVTGTKLVRKVIVQ
ncbi:MAG: hypothetical protein J6A47_09160 [Bacilli bacterium]|nr:hypothetical protein [Bacilli bacterium]